MSLKRYLKSNNKKEENYIKLDINLFKILENKINIYLELQNNKIKIVLEILPELETLDLKDLILYVEKNSKLTKKQISTYINKKTKEYSGLITNLGSINILIRELGLNIYEQKKNYKVLRTLELQEYINLTSKKYYNVNNIKIFYGKLKKTHDGFSISFKFPHKFITFYTKEKYFKKIYEGKKIKLIKIK